MPHISKGRRTGQAAVNALRTLLEEHDHIVQEISGQNDFGEDLYVTFVENELVTSDVIRMQVKGGDRWRRGHGYAVPVEHHAETWANGNIPVYCVVHDPDTKRLHWANATQQLRQSGALNSPRHIGISPNAVLDDVGMESFVHQARQYVGRYRGRQAVLTHLSEMSGAEFDPIDHVLHFVNGEDEDLIFWKRPGDAAAHLLLSAQDWEPALVSLESLLQGELPEPQNGHRLTDPDLWSAEDLELSRPEIMWVVSCFISTRQADKGIGDDLVDSAECEGCTDCLAGNQGEHGSISADVLHEYVLAKILARIEAEPDLVQRSIGAIRKDAEIDPGIVAELGPLETEPHIVRQVRRLSRTTVATVDDIGPDAYRLAILYLIRRIYVGGPSLPIDQQVEIVWRVPEPEFTAGMPGVQ